MAFSRPLTPQLTTISSSGFRTPPDQEMSDQISLPQPSPRPSLPSSSADFALANSSAPVSPSTSTMVLDDPMNFTSPFASPSPSVSAVWNYSNSVQGPLSAGAAYPLLRKLRRPSTLGLGIGNGQTGVTNGIPSSSRMNSPLVSSFTSPFLFDQPSRSSPSSRPQARPSAQTQEEEEEFTPILLQYEPRESSARDMDRDSAPISSSSSSTNPRKSRQRISRSMSPSTPPTKPFDLDPLEASGDVLLRNPTPRRATAPLLRRSSSSASINELSTSTLFPLKAQSTGPSALSQQRRLAIPRLRNIITESNPSDAEMKSEAKFQRFVSSHADIPAPFRSYPRTPRSRAGSSSVAPKSSVWPTERGRFPEEAVVDDEALDGSDSGSSDGYDDTAAIGGAGMSLTDDSSMPPSLGLGPHRGSSSSLGGMLESPAGMDVDMMSSSWCGSPIAATSAIPIAAASGTATSQWRHTPPPTAAGQPTRIGKRKLDDRYDPYPSAKRRAVSPAVSISPYHAHPSLASPITIARPLPVSATSSPVLRPVTRLVPQGNGVGPSMGTGWVTKSEEREVSGAGDGVGGLKL